MEQNLPNDLSLALLRGEPLAGLPERHTLKAGPVELLFEAGSLRYFRLKGRDVLWHVYAAVRDRDWGTVPGEVRNIDLEQDSDTFTLTFESEHQQDEVHFVWQGKVTGGVDGSVTFEFDGEARSTFETNRTGFCVLHSSTCAGVPLQIEHTDGNITEGEFPTYISPHQPFKDIRAISHEITPELWARVEMTGDTFEMEDQRNWTDASFKTYCRPHALPAPYMLEEGDKVRQQVTLTLEGELPGDSSRPQTPTLTVDSNETTPLPKIGLGVAEAPLDDATLNRLKRLNLSHLRLDLDLAADYRARLKLTSQEVQQLGAGLELALYLSDDAEAELDKLAQTLGEVKPQVARFLVFHKDEASTSAKWLERARATLSSYNADVPIGGGTDNFFTELNRERPPTDSTDTLDVVTYSLNPQVHAFDNLSLTETLPTQAETVKNAAHFSGKPVVVSPVTLKMRGNPNATSEDGGSVERGDPRQLSLFGAGWTLGSLKYLSESDAVSLTYFETAGPLGVLAGATPVEGFPAPENSVYPLYHVFADVAEFVGGEVVKSSSSHPLAAEGLVLQKDGKLTLLLANPTSETQEVSLEGITGPFKARMLDETNVVEAMLEPESYRKNREDLDGTTLTLLPYAYLRLDKVS